MRRDDCGTTSPALLNRVGDWQDQHAWREFVTRYDPVIRAACREFRFDPETLEELCQRIWIALASRLRTYQYDPSKTFRGWLRRFCKSRAIDYLRARKSDRLVTISPELLNEPWDSMGSDPEDEFNEQRPALLERAERAQLQVRGRVGERTWIVFWSIAVEGASFRETAQAMRMTYAATFAAHKRVSRLLRESGLREFEDDPAATQLPDGF